MGLDSLVPALNECIKVQDHGNFFLPFHAWWLLPSAYFLIQTGDWKLLNLPPFLPSHNIPTNTSVLNHGETIKVLYSGLLKDPTISHANIILCPVSAERNTGGDHFPELPKAMFAYQHDIANTMKIV